MATPGKQIACAIFQGDFVDLKHDLFLDQCLTDLKKDIKGKKRHLFIRLLEQCELYLTVNLTREHPRGSSTFMGMAAANLSLAYRLTGQSRYLNEAKRWILTGVAYPHWGHAHLVDVDLSASWLLFGYSIAYDWLKNVLTEDEKKLIKDKLVLQGERMYDFAVSTRGKGWSTAFWQNHNWINFTGLAAAGYALENEYDKAETWTEYSKANFSLVYAGLANDGSDYEGVVYWRYGVLWLLIYAHLLKTKEKINYFESCDFLKNTFFYRLYQAAPNLEEIINFGDCHDRRSGHSAAMYYKFAAEYNNGYAQKLGCLVNEKFLFREQYESKVKPGILPEAWLELLWYEPAIKEKEFTDLPLQKYFQDLGLVVIRSSWEKDAVHFSFKCGLPGGQKQWQRSWEIDTENNWQTRGLSHQHPDNNSFIINGWGHFLAVDDGYNRTVKASEHNVVTIDGEGYEEEGQNNIWKNTPRDINVGIEEYLTQDGILYTVGETADLYKKSLGLKRFARHIFYTGKNHFITFDELISDKPNIYRYSLNLDSQAQLINKDYFQVLCGLAKMEIFCNSSEPVNFSHEETVVRAVMTTQEPDQFRETKMQTLVLKNSRKVNELYLVNVFNIASVDGETGLTVQNINTDNLIGVQISDREKSELVLFSRSGMINYKNIQSDAKWIYVAMQQDRLLKLGLNKGQYLAINGEKILDNIEKKTVFQTYKG